MALSVTDDMRGEIKRMLIQTWNVICYEMVSFSQRRMMTQGEVIRMVLYEKYSKIHGGNQRAYNLLKQMSKKQQVEIGKEAFPAETYTLGDKGDKFLKEEQDEF